MFFAVASMKMLYID